MIWSTEPKPLALIVTKEPAAAVLKEDCEALLAIDVMVRKSGSEVIEAANGSTAIDLIRTHSDKIDVILLDMTIPGRSSREVAAEVLRVDRNRK